MKPKFHFLLFLLFTLTSCDQIMDNYWDRKAEESYVSPYKGNYVGSYKGTSQGSLQVEISAKDVVTIKRTANQTGFTEEFFGSLNGASFYGTKSQSSGFSLLGNLNSTTNSFTGNWVLNDAEYGTWTLTKQ